jgi:hypothetical protein
LKTSAVIFGKSAGVFPAAFASSTIGLLQALVTRVRIQRGKFENSSCHTERLSTHHYPDRALASQAPESKRFCTQVIKVTGHKDEFLNAKKNENAFERRIAFRCVLRALLTMFSIKKLKAFACYSGVTRESFALDGEMKRNVDDVKGALGSRSRTLSYHFLAT